MRSAELSWAARRGWVPVVGSGVAVLAGRDDARPTTLRTGAMVLPLDRRVAHRSGVVGVEVATTASLTDLLPTPPTAVVVVPSEVDFPSIAEQVGGVARGLLDPDDEMLTVGAACPSPVEPGSAGDLCLYNVHVEALTEALVESVAAAERGNLTTMHGNYVLLVQRFAPPKASAVVYASHHPKVPVRISGRWGLTEGRMPADVFEVAADGRAVREQLALKPTANMTAHGGTRTVDLSIRCRNQSSLSRTSVLRLAAQARAAAVAVGHPLSLDVAMYDESPIILRCRPSL
jgi:hypothetical protein